MPSGRAVRGRRRSPPRDGPAAPSRSCGRRRARPRPVRSLPPPRPASAARATSLKSSRAGDHEDGTAQLGQAIVRRRIERDRVTPDPGWVVDRPVHRPERLAQLRRDPVGRLAGAVHPDPDLVVGQRIGDRTARPPRDARSPRRSAPPPAWRRRRSHRPPPPRRRRRRRAPDTRSRCRARPSRRASSRRAPPASVRTRLGRRRGPSDG